MKHSVPHSLGKDKAQKVARAAFAAYAAKFSNYAAKANWLSDERAEISFSIKGMNLVGKVAVKDSEFELDLDVPFFLKPFQKVAVTKIEEEIGEWTSKAERGELG